MADVGAAELAIAQEGMTEQQKMMFLTQYTSDKKDRTVSLILSLVLGCFGVDRFYVGDIGLGVLKLLTFGVCGIMYVIDFFLIMGRADSNNRLKVQEIAATIRPPERHGSDGVASDAEVNAVGGGGVVGGGTAGGTSEQAIDPAGYPKLAAAITPVPGWDVVAEMRRRGGIWSIATKFLLFAGLYGVMALVVFAVVGAVVGGVAGSGASSFSEGAELGSFASMEFVVGAGWLIHLICAIVGAIIVFGNFIPLGGGENEESGS